MGLPLVFVLYPPGMGDIADDRLSAWIDVHVLDYNFLPAIAPHLRKRVHLSCEGPL